MSARTFNGLEPTLSAPREGLHHPMGYLSADHRLRQRRLAVA